MIPVHPGSIGKKNEIGCSKISGLKAICPEMLDALQSFFSVRFLKFCTVGASGIVVNFVFLALFADVLAVQANIASALAIEMSVNSNFLVNELWTFRDRHVSAGRFRRWAKYHVVSLVGGSIQWVVFIGCNLLLYILMEGKDDYFTGVEHFGFIERYLVRPIIHPPEVGNWKYLSQLLGIGAATFWNYIVNFYWTWARGKEATDG